MTGAQRECCCGMNPDPDTRQKCLRSGRDLGFTTQHCQPPGPECAGCPRTAPDGDPCPDCGAAFGACNCETYRRRRYGAEWEEET